MIDISTVRYRVFVVDNKKNKYRITDFVENLGWEENDGEISMRTSFAVRNDKTPKGYLSDLIKPGYLIYVSAKHGIEKYKEVARGYVVTRENIRKNNAHDLKCVCYDELYNLQKSQDNFYFLSGTGTKARIKQVLKKWKVPLGTYRGPDKKHGKKKYQSECLSDIILDILDDAVKRGGKKCILRMEKKKAAIVPLGSNDPIYVFNRDSAVEVRNKRSTENLVTRVKVIGRSDREGKDSVSATLDGLTKYGIRQKIYARGSDETLGQAKKAAREILNEQGDIEDTITVQSPDVPYVRKGDMVYIKVGAIVGYYYVKSIQHDAASLNMTMNLESAEKSAVSKNKKSSSVSYKTGDVVTFNGGKYYASANGTKGFSAKAGKAKITKKKESGKHPYHLVHTSRKSDVYGWVDNGTFS